ncbi:hypothetical protein A1D29_06945 [Pasteurellaceae bacterium Orientalotternb1]|nr:hypothetical protein A1D29_06945 [Pasteurellaceae bacterium Orientalotternb1]
MTTKAEESKPTLQIIRELLQETHEITKLMSEGKALSSPYSPAYLWECVNNRLEAADRLLELVQLHLKEI